MNQFQRFVTMLLVVALMVPMLPSFAFAASKEDFAWSVMDDGTVCIDSFTGKERAGDTHVVIPAEIDGLPVTKLAQEAFAYNGFVDTIVIPESVTFIGNSAFYHCSDLDAIVFRGQAPELAAPAPVETTQPAEPEIISVEIPMEINPLYEGAVSDAGQVESAPAMMLSEPEYGTVEEAVVALREGMKNRANTITVYVHTTAQDHSAIFYEMFDRVFDHTGVPTEGDYLAFHYKSRGGNISGSGDGLGNKYLAYRYDLTYYDTTEQQEGMDAAVETLLAKLDLAGKSDYEKICAIYDWMCENITYDYDHLEAGDYPLMYTAYAALVNKTAVCQGYANLFYRLALEAGVDNRIVSGIGNGGPHAWNIVKLDGLYYEVTFLDANGQRISNQDAKLTVPEGASVGLYGVDAEGNVTTPSCREKDGLVEFVADGSEFYVLAQPAPLPPVAKIGDVEYETVAQALENAKSGDRVQLIADAAEEGTVVIPVGVTLDLGAYTLEAGYVIGVNGGLLTATPNQGKLVMNKDALILGQEGYRNAEGMYVLPLWDPSQNCYQFCLFEVNSDPGKNRGLTIDQEAGVLYFQFKHRATDALNKRLLSDGAGDNAATVIIRLQWTNANGTAYQDFCYNDLQVGKVTGSFDYTFTLTGYSALNIDLNTLKVQAMVVTDSGATAFGTVWDHTNVK